MLLYSRPLKSFCHAPCDLKRQQRRYGVSYLSVLVGSIAFKKIVIGECLQSCRFPDREATTLGRVVMNIVVPIISGPSLVVPIDSIGARVARNTTITAAVVGVVG